jgi:hypothetical protein
MAYTSVARKRAMDLSALTNSIVIEEFCKAHNFKVHTEYHRKSKSMLYALVNSKHRCMTPLFFTPQGLHDYVSKLQEAIDRSAVCGKGEPADLHAVGCFYEPAGWSLRQSS